MNAASESAARRRINNITFLRISIYCFPHKPVFNERELNARDIKLATNYFPFIVDDHFNIGKMAVTFTPEIPEDNGRYRRIVFSSIKNQVQEKFGNYIFNNTILFVSRYDTIMDGDGEVSFEAKGRDNEKNCKISQGKSGAV